MYMKLRDVKNVFSLFFHLPVYVWYRPALSSTWSFGYFWQSRKLTTLNFKKHYCPTYIGILPCCNLPDRSWFTPYCLKIANGPNKSEDIIHTVHLLVLRTVKYGLVCPVPTVVPAEIFLVKVFRPENVHQWKFSWKTCTSRRFPAKASDFFPKRKHWVRTS